MTPEQHYIIESATQVAETAIQLNKQVADTITRMIEEDAPPEHYTQLLDGHTSRTQTITKLLYMIGTWQETWSIDESK